jgi:hypothetical protein
MLMILQRGRSDDGVIAIITAFSAIMLFAVAALVVDLGNAYAHKRELQNQADFAALAAGATMKNNLSGTPSATDPAVIAAAVYLAANWSHDDDHPSGGPPAQDVIRSALVDNVAANGEACYGTFNGGACVGQAGKFSVLTPNRRTNFAFAPALGSTVKKNTIQAATATVSIGSPARDAGMPFYAVGGVAGSCDWGSQKLSDPANGQRQISLPSFVRPAETNKSSLTSLSPAAVPSGAAAQPTITITGTGLSSVTRVGFFRDSSLSPNLVEVVIPTPDSSGKIIGPVTVPVAVTSVTDVWYVRVFGTANGQKPDQYSAASEALPLRVGDALFQCAGTSNNGNFGSIKVPRSTSNPNDALALNIALGPELPLSLAVYPGGLSAPATCTSSSPSVVSPPLTPGTNCVGTDTGLTANGTTAGLITGVGGNAGRLIKPTGQGCDPDGGSAQRSVSMQGSYALNNDILTCFLTSDTVSLNTISQVGYSGPAVLSEAIYSSPRFCWVPVIKQTPVKGASTMYSIVDFRAAFITGQPLSATKTNRWPTTTDKADNGVTISNNGVTAMQVVFFNSLALPNAPGSVPIGPYRGVGPQVVQLVD